MDEEVLKKNFDNSLDKFKNILPSDIALPFDTSQIIPFNVGKENPALWAHKRIVEYIKLFEKELDEEHEIGAHLVSGGNFSPFYITDIGYYGPDIITFYGTDAKGQHCQLIQNVSQLNVLLIALKKLHETPNRLGFDLESKGT
jgi:hypothetical protein